MINILTNEQVRKALYLDKDFEDVELLAEYSAWATSFIYEKIGAEINSLPTSGQLIARDLAKMLIKNRHFANSSKDYSEKFDYTLGINNAIVDLQNIVRSKEQQ